MTNTVAAVFHAAQEAALRASVPLATAMGTVRVYTDAPPTNAPSGGSVFPYIRTGDNQYIDDSDECQDGTEIVATSHVFDRPEPISATRALQIAGIVRSILNAALTLTGHEVVLHEFIDMRQVTDPTGATHVVITHRYLTVPTT